MTNRIFECVDLWTSFMFPWISWLVSFLGSWRHLVYFCGTFLSGVDHSLFAFGLPNVPGNFPLECGPSVNFHYFISISGDVCILFSFTQQTFKMFILFSINFIVEIGLNERCMYYLYRFQFQYVFFCEVLLFINTLALFIY